MTRLTLLTSGFKKKQDSKPCHHRQQKSTCLVIRRKEDDKNVIIVNKGQFSPVRRYLFTIFQAFNKKLYQDLQYNRDLRVTFNNITEDNISRKSGTKTLNTIPVSGSTVPHHSIRETARKKSKRAYCERSGEMTRRERLFHHTL